MRFYKQLIYLTALVLLTSGCGTQPRPSESTKVDETLPLIQLTKSGIFTDMKAVGFEWNLINDTRVKGVYVYKQAEDAVTSEHDYYKTIDNRFVTHFIDDDVEPGKQYSYFFKTFSNDAESNPTVAFKATTQPPLESVSWIYANQNMPRSAKIIWRPHINQIVQAYIIERKTLEEDTWQEIDRVNGRLNVEYIDTELKDSFVYKYRLKVLTYNDIISKPSAEVKVVTKALPDSVAKITATKNLPQQIRLTWSKTNIKDFSHYNIYRSESNDGSFSLIKKTKETKYIDTVQEHGKNYFYKISAVDQDELESKHDAVVAHGKTLQRPETPSLVEVRMVGENLQIRWSSTDRRVKSFIVERESKKGFFNSSIDEFVDIKGKVFVDRLIEPETTYTYTVYSVDEFSIKSKPSIEVKYTTTEAEGKVIQKANLEEVRTRKQPAKVKSDSSTMVIKPLTDIDMSVR